MSNKTFSFSSDPLSNLKMLTMQYNIQAAWNYYENKSNGEIFTQDEMTQWNRTKKDTK
jgi:hypothetical protein